MGLYTFGTNEAAIGYMAGKQLDCESKLYQAKSRNHTIRHFWRVMFKSTQCTHAHTHTHR